VKELESYKTAETNEPNYTSNKQLALMNGRITNAIFA
jgi:hypothetical protein